MNHDRTIRRIKAVVGDMISAETLRNILKDERDEPVNVNHAKWFVGGVSQNKIWAHGVHCNALILETATDGPYGLGSLGHYLTGTVDLHRLVKLHNEALERGV